MMLHENRLMLDIAKLPSSSLLFFLRVLYLCLGCISPFQSLDLLTVPFSHPACLLAHGLSHILMAISEIRQGHTATQHQMEPWISQLKPGLRAGGLRCLIYPHKLSHHHLCFGDSLGTFQLLLSPHSHGPYTSSADSYTELSLTSASNKGIFSPNDLCFITRE